MTRSLAGTKICVFDAYGTLFDFNSAVARHRAEIGPQADRLAEMWRSKQISYTWLRSLMGAYVPFRQVTREGLDHCLAACGVTVPGIADRMMEAYLSLDPFPEVRAMLATLKARGTKLAILSNGDPDMLDAVVANTGLAGTFEALLSADSVGVFKTDSRVYDLVGQRFGVRPDKVCFLSSNGWDAQAAAHYGFRTLWINRAGAPRENLPGELAGELPSLAPLPGLLDA